MMTESDLTWEFRSGRYSEDVDGHRFRSWILIHGSGRAMGAVHCPLSDEWWFRCVFYLDPSLDRDDFRFMDEDSGKRFVVQQVLQFHNKEPEKQEESEGPPRKRFFALWR